MKDREVKLIERLRDLMLCAQNTLDNLRDSGGALDEDGLEHVDVVELDESIQQAKRLLKELER